MLDFIKAVFFLFFLSSTAGYAQNLQDDFYTVRPKGMGGAFVSIANDTNAGWYNPAGIARMRRSRARRKLHIFTFPNLQAAWNASGLNYTSTIVSGNDEQALSDIVADTSDTLGAQNIFANVSAFPLIGFDTSKGSQAPIIIGAFVQSPSLLLSILLI